MIKDIAIGAGGLGFDSRAGQIRHTVADGSPALQRFFEAVLPTGTCGQGRQVHLSKKKRVEATIILSRNK